jgi:hypothetical protein
MAYELTINRVMGLCSFGSKHRDGLTGRDLVLHFRKQMIAIYDHQLPEIYRAITAAALREKIKIEDLEEEEGTKAYYDPNVSIFPESEDPIISGGTPRTRLSELNGTERLVGLFKSKRFLIHLGDMIWETRVRASVTACALERPGGLAKLWWTFEGVPADSGAAKRPTEKDSVAFIEATKYLADDVMPLLRTAYAAGYENVMGEGPGQVNCDTGSIRVSLADNDSRPFAKLVDAMNLRRAKFTDVRDGHFGEEAAACAKELLKFIADVSKKEPDPNMIELETSQPGATAIYYSTPVADDGLTTRVVVGLASSIDMLAPNPTGSIEWQRINKRPSLLRSVSAARPLSAKIANEQAMRLEQR